MSTIQRGVWREDRATLRPVTRSDDGSIRCDARLARVGVLTYLQSDGSTRRELRLASDVFDGPALRSFDLRPLADDHPHSMVHADNVGDVAVGAVTNPRRDGDYLRGDLTVWHPDVVAKMERGKVELSGGYLCDTVEEPGTHPVYGAYDARQVRIAGNHVALVDRGRAGPECRARMDRAAIMVVDEDDDDAPPAPRPTTIGPGDVVNRDAWARAWRAGFAAEDRHPDEHRAKRVDAFCAAVRRSLTPEIDRLRSRTRVDAAPAFVLRLPSPPNFSPRLSPQPRTDTAMGKKNKQDKSPFKTEAELMELQRRSQAYAGTGMRLDEVERAIKKSDKRIRKDREASAAAAQRRADAAPAFTPRYTTPAPRADAGPSEAELTERMRQRSERQWNSPGNAVQLRRDGEGF